MCVKEHIERFHFHLKRMVKHPFFVDGISRIPTKKQVKDFWREHHYRMIYIAIFFIFCSVVLHIKALAEIGSVNLYSENCHGDWQHPERASGVPDVQIGSTNFLPDNSAVPINNPSHIDCALFKGNIPDGVLPKKITVHLSWFATSEPIPSTPILIKDDATTTVPLETIPSVIPVQDFSTNTQTNPVSSSTDIISTTTDIQSSSSTTSTQDQTLSTPTPTSTSTTTDIQSSSSTTDIQNTIMNTAVTSTEIKNPPIESTNLPAQDFLELQYTTDGINWQKLGAINNSNYKNVSFEINSGLDISKWENLSNLQIRISTLLPDSELPNLYIDSVYLEADYEDIPKLADPPKIVLKDSSSVLDGKIDFSSDENPTFVVTDPGLTTNDIQNLVDNKQAEVVQDFSHLIDVASSSTTTSTSTTDILNNIKTNVVDPAVNNIEQTIQKTNSTVVSFVMPSVAEAAGSSATITDAKVLDYAGSTTDIPVVISTVVVNGVNKQKISITKPSRSFRPGKYTLNLTLNTAQAIIVSQQDFTWGVLTINTDKSIYKKGDTAFLQMGVINDLGHTICDADLSLVVTTPDGSTYPFASSNNSISQSGDCRGDSYVTTPDYFAYFKIPEINGDYRMVLTAVTANGTRSIVSHFSVEDNPSFDVVRSGPTRIYPVYPYLVSLKITSPVDWSGQIVEKVPSSFDITQSSYVDQYQSITTSADGQEKIISWNLSLNANEQKTIGYYFKAPLISPEFYLLGPLSFYSSGADISSTTPVFQESRQWQIADDAACTATISGTWNTVNTGGMWSGCTGTGGVPGVADDVIINPGVIVTLGAATPAVNSLTVSGTLNTSAVSSYALNSNTLSISNTGSLVANNSTITLSGTTAGTLMSLTGAGIFTAGGSTVTLTGLGSNTINSSGFTGSNALKNLTISSSGFVKTLGANIAITGLLNITAGTLDTSSVGNYSITTGNFLSTNIATAIFNGNNSTITLNGTTGNLINKGTASILNTTSTNLIVASDAAITISVGNINFNNLTLSPVITTNRLYTFNTGGATTTMSGSLDINPTGTGTLTVTAGGVINIANNVQVRGTGATSVFNSSSVLTLTSINISSGDTYNAGNGGAVTFNGVTDTPITGVGTFSVGTTVISFTGTHATTNIQIPSKTYGPVTFNRSGETYMLTGNIIVSGALNLSNGTLDTSVSNYSITSTTFTTGATSTAILNSNSSNFTINGTFGKGAGSVLNTSNTNFFVTADAAISVFNNPVSMKNLTFNPVLTTSRTWTLNNSAAGLTISGAFDVVPSGSGVLTINQAGSVLVSGSSTIEGTGSSTSVFSGLGQTFNTGTLLIASTGTYNAGGSSLTLTGTSDTPLIVNGTFIPGTSTVTFSGMQAVTNVQIPAISYYNLILNNVSGLYFLTGTTTVLPAGTLTISNGTLDTNSSSNYSLSVGHVILTNLSTVKFLINASTVTFTGTTGNLFTINGTLCTFTAGTNSNVIMNPDAAIGTLAFSGSAVAVTFYNLTFSPVLTTNRTYIITSNANVVTVNNDFTVNPSGSGVLTVLMGYNMSIGNTGTTIIEGTGGSATSILDISTVPRALTTGFLDVETTGSLVGPNANTITVTGTATSTDGISPNNIFKMLGTFTPNTSTVTFTGGTSSTNIPAISYYNLTLNNSSYTYFLTGTTTILAAGTLTISNGTLDTNSSSNYSLIAGHIVITSVSTAKLLINASTLTFNSTAGIPLTVGALSVFTAGTGSNVVFNSFVASGSMTLVSGAATYYNVSITPVIATNSTVLFNASSTLNGDFMINPSGSGVLTVSVSTTVVSSTKTTTLKGSGGATSLLGIYSSAGAFLSTGFLDLESTGAIFMNSGGTLPVLNITATSDNPVYSSGSFGSYTYSGIYAEVAYTGVQATTAVNIANLHYNKLTVNNASATFIPPSGLVTDGVLTVTTGLLNTSHDGGVTSNNLSIGQLSVAAAGYFTANNSTITVTGNNGIVLACTSFSQFSAGTSTFIVTPTAAGSLFAGGGAGAGFHFYNVTLAPIMSGSPYTITSTGSNSNDIIDHNFTINPSGSGLFTFSVNSGMNGFGVSATGTTNLSASGSATLNYLNNAGLAWGMGNVTIGSGATYTGSLLVSGTTNTPLQVTGTGSYVKSTGTVSFTGGSGVTTIPGLNYYNLTINSAVVGVTFVPADNNINVDVGGTFTMTSGSFNTNSLAASSDPTHDMNISLGHLSILAGQTFAANSSIVKLTGTSGVLLSNAGVFNFNTSTVIVTSASGTPTIFNGVITMHKLTINAPGSTVIGLSNTYVNFDNTTGSRLYIQAGVLNESGALITAGASSELKIDNTGTLCLGGALTSTTATCDSGATVTVSTGLPVFGTYTLSSNSTIVFLSDAALSGTNIPSAPTYGNIKFTPKFVATNRTYTPQGALNINGSLTIAPTNTTNTLTVNLAGTTTILGGLNIVPATASTTLAVLDTTSSNYSLSAGSIDIESGGTLVGHASTITIGGNWTNNGNFTTGTSTVVLNSTTTALISGTSTTFYNLSILPSAAKEIDFSVVGSPIYHVTNRFIATGHLGSLITLRSTSPGVQWKFHPTGTFTSTSTSYIDVKDGGCQPGSSTMYPATNVNSGDNDLCWGFNSYLTFSISSPSVGFGSLSSSFSRYSTSNGIGSSSDVEGNNISVAAFSLGGYSISVLGGSLVYGSHTIPPMGNSNIAPSTGFEQFGIRAIATGGNGVVQAPYSGSGFALPSSASTTPSLLATESAGFADGVPTVYSLHYVANIAPNTPAGKYSTSLMFLITGTF